jgi:transmembrane sensor
MMRAADIEAQAADWLARRDGDDWSDAQQRELDAWIDAATAHRIAYLRLDSVWRRADRLGSLHAPGKNAVPPASSMPLFGNVGAHGWRIAAGVAVLAGAAWFMASSGIVDRPAGYATALGQSTSLALADGTRVTLNTNTHLRAKLAGARRTVWLDKGEAYFEVAHDASRPFVVEAGARRITVLGTKFSVRRDNGGKVQVLVADGRVQVSATEGAANTTVITRNDSLTASGTSNDVAVRHNTEQQVASRLGWREGRVILDQMTLAQAAQEFNRYNRKQLIITDPSVAQLRIGGTFNVDNVDGFARLLQQGMGLRIETAGDIIKIHR